jgi:hypothetical protein
MRVEGEQVHTLEDQAALAEPEAEAQEDQEDPDKQAEQVLQILVEVEVEDQEILLHQEEPADQE